jgi:transcriptional regulator of acetoin/glycerol metabolism
MNKQLTEKEKSKLRAKMRVKQGAALETAKELEISRGYLYDALNGAKLGIKTLTKIREFIN